MFDAIAIIMTECDVRGWCIAIKKKGKRKKDHRPV